MPDEKALCITEEMSLLFEEYTDEQLGSLIREAIRYVATGEEPEFLAFYASEYPQLYVWHAMKRMIDDFNSKEH